MTNDGDELVTKDSECHPCVVSQLRWAVFECSNGNLDDSIGECNYHNNNNRDQSYATKRNDIRR